MRFIFPFIPQFALIAIGMLFILCFVSLMGGIKLFKLSKHDIANPKGSLIPLIMAVWGISVGAYFVSQIAMAIIAISTPLARVFEDMRPVGAKAPYLENIIYAFCVPILYSVLFLMSSHLLFKKLPIDVSKRRKLSVCALLPGLLLIMVVMGLSQI